MEILEFGNSSNKKLVLIHGFQCPYTVLRSYIDYYKKDFHIILPVLPGHDPKQKEEFISLDNSVKEFEDFFINKYGTEIYAVYGMSFGGVFAFNLWKNQKIFIKKLIIESSPLLPFGKFSIYMMTRWYLKMSAKVRAGDKRTLKKAVKSIVPEKYIDDFKAVVGNMSEQSIRNYISQVGRFSISGDVLAQNYDKDDATNIIYFYGGKLSEFVFRRVGKFIKHHCKKGAARNGCDICSVCKLKGKGHCEDSILHSNKWIFTLNQIL